MLLHAPTPHDWLATHRPVDEQPGHAWLTGPDLLTTGLRAAHARLCADARAARPGRQVGGVVVRGRARRDRRLHAGPRGRGPASRTWAAPVGACTPTAGRSSSTPARCRWWCPPGTPGRVDPIRTPCPTRGRSPSRPYGRWSPRRARSSRSGARWPGSGAPRSGPRWPTASACRCSTSRSCPLTPPRSTGCARPSRCRACRGASDPTSASTAGCTWAARAGAA